MCTNNLADIGGGPADDKVTTGRMDFGYTYDPLAIPSSYVEPTDEALRQSRTPSRALTAEEPLPDLRYPYVSPDRPSTDEVQNAQIAPPLLSIEPPPVTPEPAPVSAPVEAVSQPAVSISVQQPVSKTPIRMKELIDQRMGAWMKSLSITDPAARKAARPAAVGSIDVLRGMLRGDLNPVTGRPI